jgi:hypothetical protein
LRGLPSKIDGAIEQNSLKFKIGPQPWHAAFSANPGLLETAKCDCEITLVAIVAYGAATRPSRDTKGALAIIRENRRRQS